MKLLLLLVSILALAVGRPDDTYDSRFDNFNIDEIVTSSRLMRSYMKCFLEEGKCTPDGKTFKKLLPEAVQTTCGKCSETQKILVAKMLRALKENVPEEFNRLYVKYDPENKRKEYLEEFIEKHAN